MKNNSFQTLSEAVNALQARGYESDGYIEKNSLHVGNKNFRASEVQISEFHRFEGMTNPSDTSIIYALEAKNENTRCLLINSYGAKASEEISNFIKEVEIDE